MLLLGLMLDYYLDVIYLFTEAFRFESLRILFILATFIPMYACIMKDIVHASVFYSSFLSISKHHRTLCGSFKAFGSLFSKNDHIHKLLLFLLYNCLRLGAWIILNSVAVLAFLCLCFAFIAVLSILNLHYVLVGFVLYPSKLIVNSEFQMIWVRLVYKNVLKSDSDASLSHFYKLIAPIDLIFRCVVNAVLIVVNFYYLKKVTAFVLIKLILSLALGAISLLYIYDSVVVCINLIKCRIKSPNSASQGEIFKMTVIETNPAMVDVYFQEEPTKNAEENENGAALESKEIAALEILKKELLVDLESWKGNSLLSSEEELHIHELVSNLKEEKCQKFLHIYTDCKSRHLSNEKLAELLKSILEQQLSQHLEALKSKLLSDVILWADNGILTADEAAAFLFKLSNSQDSDLYVILGYYESALDENKTANEIVDEIKQLS
jgi:hypothetical protein